MEEHISDMGDMLCAPALGDLKLELDPVALDGDEALALDFVQFPGEHDDWGLASHTFESAGGDSGFSSPQDSPRDDWWMGFPDSMDDSRSAAGSRSRLLSMSSLPNVDLSLVQFGLPPMNCVKTEGGEIAVGNIEGIGLLDLPGLDPMVDGSVFSKLVAKLDFSAIRFDSLGSLDSIMPDVVLAGDFHHHDIMLDNVEDQAAAAAAAASVTTACDELPSVSAPTSAANPSSHTPASTAPSSPAALGGINPGLLTQYEDDPDLEIDVVGDGEYVYSNSSFGERCDSNKNSNGSEDSGADTDTLNVDSPAPTVVPLSREGSTMSTASTLSSSSTDLCSQSPSLSAAKNSSNGTAMHSSAATSHRMGLPLIPLPTASSHTRAASLSSSSSSPPDMATAASARSTTSTPAGLPPHALVGGLPSLHGHMHGVPPLHMHIPGLTGLPSLHHMPGMGGSGKSASSSRAGPYPKRNSERKRHLHNELERKRREDLNLTFFRLGDLLPNLKGGSASQPTQVHILQGAAQHIRDLKEKQGQLTSTRAALQEENQRLQERLRELQAMCMTN